ncbi:MAG: carbonic anhydrase family protein [Chlorobi bacterium]|nr:carbonic anhydrase family protein [Chlorobiota bacterium]
MKNKLNLLATVSFLLLFACNTNENNRSAASEQQTGKHKTALKDCNKVHWSHHKGENGPSHWKNLCEGFAACGGKAQSPVNIIIENVSVDNTLMPPVFNYEKSETDIINNGHTVQFNTSGNQTVTLNGKEYKLLQFHYHTLSEHTVNGQHYAGEIHFVHKNSDSDFAVLGVMIEEGEENTFFDKFEDKFPLKEGEYKSDDTFDVMSLLPDNKSYYYYSGSLTTPPCSEVVNWYMFVKPVTASEKQIKKLSEILNDNYRPVQKLNGRKIKLYKK